MPATMSQDDRQHASSEEKRRSKRAGAEKQKGMTRITRKASRTISIERPVTICLCVARMEGLEPGAIWAPGAIVELPQPIFTDYCRMK